MSSSEMRDFRGEMRVFGGEMRDFRQATVASFNAMREDLVDLRSQVDGGFSQLRSRLDTTAAGLAHITDLLNQLVADRESD